MNPCSAETGIFQENFITTMDLDVLASCFAKSSGTMVLNIWDKHVLVSLKKDFKYPHRFIFEI